MRSVKRDWARRLMGFAAGVALLWPAAAMAVPSQLTVQGYLRTEAGLGADGSFAIRFALYDAETAGNTLFSVTQVGVPVASGLFDAVLSVDDGGTPLGVAVFRDNPQVWLGIKIEAGPGVALGGEAELPRTVLTTVGYAFVAAHADRAAVADQAADLDCAGAPCVSEVELDFDPVTQAELTAALAALGPHVTSVDGLTGGTITSDVTVSGALAVTGTITQGGNAVCDASGNCGQSLFNTTCQADQVLTYDGSAWVCTDFVSAGTPTDACNGLNQVLQWDGSAWVCVDSRTTGLSAGQANGYELVDDWGYAWDGIQRAPKTWAEAKAACEADGGRLPTVTELYRNNAGSTGTGNISTPSDTAYLWTLIASDQANTRVGVRLSDGAINYPGETSTYAFRCVWPDHTSTAFEGDYCYGPPGTECKPYGFVWNVDKMDRPALREAAAANECNFYNASLPTQQEFAELVQFGWENPSNSWLWMAESKYLHSGNYGYALGRWSADPQPWWGFDAGTDGTLTQGTSGERFRCIGKRSAGEGTQATATCLNDNCLTITTHRRSKIIADNEDRPNATFNDAAQTCEALGGALPDAREFEELVHAGWSTGTNAWLWTDEHLYWYNNGDGYTILRWNGKGSERWYMTGGTMERSGPTSSRPYRCVWHESMESPAAAMRNCAPGEEQVWDGSAFKCQASVKGTSCDSDGANCQANPNGIQIVDDWGNAWDLIQRQADTYANATAACDGAGGRLPTATELFRVRANQTLVSSIGDSNSVSYLWTIVPEYRSDRQTMVRVSDGAATGTVRTSTAPYRCVWPTTKGEAFGGRSCYGDPDDGNGGEADPCFETGRVRTDQLDRAAISAPSAAWECAYYGGRLPDTRELREIIYGGAPNGSNTWLWVNRPLYWYSGGYGYAIERWSGVGNTGFAVNDTYGTMSGEGSYRPFRCVFSDRME